MSISARTDNDVQAWEFIDALGTVHPLDTTTGIVPGQTIGAATPPTKRRDVQIPGRPGVFNLDRSYGAKEWSMQATLYSKAYPYAVNVEEVIAAWASRLNLFIGPGTIRRTRADGVTKRVIGADYSNGMGIDQRQSILYKGAQQVALTWFSADPFWYDDDYTVVEFSAGTQVGFFPIPNPTTGSFVTLAASEVFGQETINNDGDIPAWPVWTIEGPASTIVLQNLTTGESLSLTDNGGLSLLAGQVLTIDTRPGTAELTLADGANVAAYMTDDSTLWALALGNNQIQVQMGSTTGASSADVAYRRGWLAP